jgi:hypothetical protein
MSYLEQLKNEAQARQAQERAEQLEQQQQQAQRQKRFIHQVKPSLQRLRDYLRELAEQLNYLKLETKVSYNIKGYGEVEDFQQQDYRIILLDELKAINGQFPRRWEKKPPLYDTSCDFVLRYRCQTPYKIRFRKRKQHDMVLQKNYLIKHQIPFSCEEETDANFQFESALFVIEPVIYVSMEFAGHFETSTIDLTVKNLTEFGQKTYTLVPNEINDCFLDELAKYITRQPNLVVLREKNPLAHRRRKTLRTKLPPKPLVTKTASTTEDCNEFEQWLRTQEQQLAATAKSPTTKRKGLFQLFKKIGK